jgi:hypothetical protein
LYLTLSRSAPPILGPISSMERLTCAFSCRTHPQRCGMVVFCFPCTNGKAHTSSLSPLSLLGMYLSFLSSLPHVRFVQQQATSAATTRPQPPSQLQQWPPLQQHVSSSIYFLGDGTHEVSASSSTSVSVKRWSRVARSRAGH